MTPTEILAQCRAQANLEVLNWPEKCAQYRYLLSKKDFFERFLKAKSHPEHILGANQMR